MIEETIDVTQLPWPGEIVLSGNDQDGPYVVVRISRKYIFTINDNAPYDNSINIVVRKTSRNPSSWRAALDIDSVASYEDVAEPLAALAIAHDLFNKHNASAA